SKIQQAAESIDATASAYARASEQAAKAMADLVDTLPSLTRIMESMATRIDGLEVALVVAREQTSQVGNELKAAISALGSEALALKTAVTERHDEETRFLHGTDKLMRELATRLNALEDIERRILEGFGAVGILIAGIEGRLAEPLGKLPDKIGDA